MEAKAQARYVRVAPRKARMVVDLVRGKSVARAREILQFSTRDAAEPVAKVIDSAVANAEQAEGSVDPDALFVKTICVDDAPTFKRYQPRAKGAAEPIRHRSSHITVVVATREEA
ncbi:MAG: 50S ribosomal protein L22 [Coriobacteriales bacterium]